MEPSQGKCSPALTPPVQRGSCQIPFLLRKPNCSLLHWWKPICAGKAAVQVWLCQSGLTWSALLSWSSAQRSRAVMLQSDSLQGHHGGAGWSQLDKSLQGRSHTYQLKMSSLLSHITWNFKIQQDIIRCALSSDLFHHLCQGHLFFLEEHLSSVGAKKKEFEIVVYCLPEGLNQHSWWPLNFALIIN